MKTQDCKKTLRSAQYVLPGNPNPLKRPRFGKDIVYDAQKNVKLLVGITLQNQHDNKPFFEGPLSIDIGFFMEIPPSRPRHLHEMPHSIKPDLDNLIKFLLDVATGIIFKDDCSVVKISASKLYSISPRTEFTIKEIE